MDANVFVGLVLITCSTFVVCLSVNTCGGEESIASEGAGTDFLTTHSADFLFLFFGDLEL